MCRVDKRSVVLKSVIPTIRIEQYWMDLNRKHFQNISMDIQPRKLVMILSALVSNRMTFYIVEPMMTMNLYLQATKKIRELLDQAGALLMNMTVLVSKKLSS